MNGSYISVRLNSNRKGDGPLSEPASIQAVPVIAFRPKPNLNTTLDQDFYCELGKSAKEILELKNAFDSINANRDPFSADRISLRLTAAEQEFFLIFNKLREQKGYPTLPGKRFTGIFSYESYLYQP